MIRLFRQYISLRKWGLIVAQTLLFAACLYLAAVLRFWNNHEQLIHYITMPRFGVRLAFLTIGVQASLLLTDYYERVNQKLATDDFLCLGQALGFAGIL